MIRVRLLGAVLAAVAAGMLSGDIRAAQMTQSGAPAGAAERDLFVTVGKSLVVESPVNIQRISVGDAKKAEAIAVTPREVLVNGKEAGETSLFIWQAGGNRLVFDLRIQPSTVRLEVVREEMAKELPGQNVAVTQDGDNVFLRGTVDTLMAAERAAAIANTLGKAVNLLRVKVPPIEDQILLKVRFVDVDRSVSQDLGVNLFSTGATNTIGGTTTGAYTPPTLQVQPGAPTTLTLSNALNLFLFRPDLGLGTTIEALENKQLAQTLAEPNLLTISGKPASFLAGGEIPVPIAQPSGGGAPVITIQWKEYGIRLNFLPVITPRGTIRMKVVPEVSSLGTTGVTISGFAIPNVLTKRVETEVELQDGQTFGLAGLLDNELQESWNKIPGIGDIPVLGKLFQSRHRLKSNEELLVLVTPEIVRPIPAGQPVPEVKLPQPFLEGAPTKAPRTPPKSVTGPVPVTPAQPTVPVEQLEQLQQQGQSQTPAAPTQMLLVPIQPQAPPVQPGTLTGPPPSPENK